MELLAVKDALDAVEDFEQRDYLGMSQIWKCPRVLYEQFVNGRQEPDRRGRRLCHEGYVHEADVISRLLGGGLVVFHPGKEIVADFDERFRGHIDGEFEDGTLLEVKSVTTTVFAQVMERGPRLEHLDQVRMYLKYGGYERGLIVYKERQYGDLWLCEVWRDEGQEARLEAKARSVLAAVDAGVAPGCECGKCR